MTRLTKSIDYEDFKQGKYLFRTLRGLAIPLEGFSLDFSQTKTILLK